MLKTIKNAFKTPEIRKKILYTLLLLVIFRLGCYITIPGVDIVTLESSMDAYSNSVTGMINMISGGAFSRLSIFAMFYNAIHYSINSNSITRNDYTQL